MKRIVTVLLFLVVLPLAIYVVNHHFFPDRNIASTNESVDSVGPKYDYDLSEASPEEFIKAFKYQVLKNAVSVETTVGPGLRLGSFLMKNSEGNKIFVCEEFPTIDLIFAAEGIAHSGEVPQMVVRGPCLSSTDQKYIEAFPIPFKKILTAPPGQAEFKFTLPDSREQIAIYFKNVVDSWPTDWNWVGVKLYGKKPGQMLEINGYEVISVKGQPVTLTIAPTE